MSTGFYLLVRFDSRAKLPGVIEKLDALPQVKNWNAVDGFYSLVVEAESETVADQLSQIDGFTELARCEKRGDNDLAESNEGLSSSYLFIETENHKQTPLIEELSAHEMVRFVTPTIGDYDLVAVVDAANFDLIDRVVNEEFRQLDGIVRLKQDRIIHLDRI